MPAHKPPVPPRLAPLRLSQLAAGLWLRPVSRATLQPVGKALQVHQDQSNRLFVVRSGTTVYFTAATCPSGEVVGWTLSEPA